MEFKDQENLKAGYRALVEAIGIEYDETKVAPLLKKFINDAVNTAMKEGGTTVKGLSAKVSNAVREIEKVKADADAARHNAYNLRLELSKMHQSGIVEEVRRAYREQEAVLREKCEEMVQQYSQQLNPFHQATEDFLTTIEAHGFTPDLAVEPLCKFLEAMSYAYWRVNGKNNDPDNDDKWRPKKAGRTI